MVYNCKPATGEERPVDPYGLLAKELKEPNAQASGQQKTQSNKTRWTEPEEQPPRLSSGSGLYVHLHSCAPTCVNIQTQIK